MFIFLVVQFRWGLRPHTSHILFSILILKLPDTRRYLHSRCKTCLSSTLVRCIVHSVATGLDWSDESETRTVGRWIHGEGEGWRWTESFGKSARAFKRRRARQTPRPRWAASGGNACCLHLVEVRRERRGDGHYIRRNGGA